MSYTRAITLILDTPIYEMLTTMASMPDTGTVHTIAGAAIRAYVSNWEDDMRRQHHYERNNGLTELGYDGWLEAKKGGTAG